MSKYNKTQAPYYDYGDSELLKQYYQLLAIPGRVAQAREISTLQTILQGIIKSLGDSIMRNGDIIEGCQVITSEDKKSVTVTPGKIYMDGIVTPFGSKESESTELLPITIPIRGSGSEIIGVTINEYIITEESDYTLRDPAQGFDNYNQPGCNRIKRELALVSIDSLGNIYDGNGNKIYDVDKPKESQVPVSYSSIALLYDGDLAVEDYAPSYDTLETTLARRTYDESGSYIVNGLTVHTEAIDSEDDELYNVVTEAGKAYVLGYELKLPTARRLENSRSTTFKSINLNEYTYQSGKLSYLLDSDPHVKDITRVSATLVSEETSVARASGDSDDLNINYTSVKLTSVKQGNTNFSIGSIEDSTGDCYLRDNRYIVWRTSNRPESGTSYIITYEYRDTLKGKEDYDLSVTPEGSYLVFLENGKLPKEDSLLIVDYDKYLSRKDLIYLDQYGKLVVIQGEPDEDGYEVAPIAPVNTLAIAQIYNPPNGSVSPTIDSLRIQVKNIGLTRFTMNDIQNIVNRVKKTEYNQAVLTLNEDARSRSTINSKKGILTDPLVDFSRIDLYYNTDSEGNKLDNSKSVYNMALDLDAGMAYLPVEITPYELVGETTNTAGKYTRLITLKPNGESVVLSQMNATKSFLVNPYSVFPQLPEVLITPAVDSWVDNTIVEVPVSLNNTRIVSTNTKILYNTVNRRSIWGGSYDYTTTYMEVSSSSSVSKVGSTTETNVTDSIISQEAITYMRQIQLTVEGKDFSPNIDNIKCKFDGIIVPLTPATGTEKGTEQGSLKADDNGYVKGTFIIPPKVRTGVREVELYSEIPVEGYKNSAYNIFQSSGTLRTIQRTVTTVTTVLLQREITETHTTVRHTYIDPVGQTFVLDRNTILKGLDVYFEGKPDSNHSIVLEIRNVTNGTIGTTVFASKSLNPSQVKVSNNATVPTRFNFDDPIVLERDTEYAFTLRSVSDKYRVWVSEIGGTDVTTGDTILKNSYLTGVMMSSSNNSSWTIHQTMDIKFALIEDVYSHFGSIEFNPITLDGCTRIELLADSVELDGTTIKWSYKVNDDSTYYSISPGSLKELNLIANKIILKVDLESSSEDNLTPLLAADSILLIGSSYELEGEYIGVNVSNMDPYKNVTVIMNTNIPSGTTITPYMSHDNGETLTELVLDTSQIKELGNGWEEHVYEGAVPRSGTSEQCRVFIKATSNSSTKTPRFSSVRIIMD